MDGRTLATVAGLLAMGLAVRSSVAQDSPVAIPAPTAIMAADIARHIQVLAHDSMRGRNTPSRELDVAAQYVADQFRQLGLKPAGKIEGKDSPPAWIQRYPIPGHLRLDLDASKLMIGLRDNETSDYTDQTFVSFADAYLDVQQVSQWPYIVDGPCRGTVLIAGRQTPESLRKLQLRSRTVLYVPPAGLDNATQQAIVDQLYTASLGVVVLDPPDSAAFVRDRDMARRRPMRIVETMLQYRLRPHGWVLHIWPRADAHLLEKAGVHTERLRADSTPVQRLVPRLYIGLNVQAYRAPDVPTAPLVVGRLEGSDTTRQSEPLVILAHLDGWSGRDSAGNGADDNASGVAGLLELAEAFNQPGARPARPVLFVAASGGAKPEFWGASYFSSRSDWQAPVGIINLDVIGGGPKDSVFVAGAGESEGIPTVDWIAMAHPELGLGVVDGGTAFTPESEHYAFGSLMGIPTFYFHTGPHGTNSNSADTPESVDAAKAARVVRLAYYVGETLANAARRPRLSQEGWRHLYASLDPLNGTP